MTDGTDDRVGYIRNLIAVRCPELGPDDLATLTQHAATETLPVEIGEQIMDVLAAMEMKLDRLAGVNKDEDDDADRRRAGA